MEAALRWIYGWLTPAAIFFVFNLFIGTVILISRRGGSDHAAAGEAGRHYLSRSASVFAFDRLRSIGLHRGHSSEIQFDSDHRTPPTDDRHDLSRSASIFALDRLRSISLHRGPSSAEIQFEADHRTPPTSTDGHHGLSRSASNFVLERLRSLGLHRGLSSEIHLDAEPPAPLPEASDRARRHHARSQSESVPLTVEERAAAAASLAKSASAKTSEAGRRPAAAAARRRAEAEEQESAAAASGGVDERADDFINRFRNHLRLQRLDSIMRYKQMLGGGN